MAQVDINDMLAKMNALAAENAALKAAANKPVKLTWKVSEKGAVSCYGNGRFPTTQYKDQWDRIFADKAGYDACVAAGKSRLKHKA